jgi:hypothetical protein
VVSSKTTIIECKNNDQQFRGKGNAKERAEQFSLTSIIIIVVSFFSLQKVIETEVQTAFVNLNQHFGFNMRATPTAAFDDGVAGAENKITTFFFLFSCR